MDQRGLTQNAAWLPLAITLWAAPHSFTKKSEKSKQSVPEYNCWNLKCPNWYLNKCEICAGSENRLWVGLLSWVVLSPLPSEPAQAQLPTASMHRLSKYKPTSTQLLWEQQEWSQLKDKTGANSIHRLKIYLWEYNLIGLGSKPNDMTFRGCKEGQARYINHKTNEKRCPTSILAL